MTDHKEVESSVVAFLLDACQPGEAAVVRRHLAGCDSCRELAGRLGQAACRLPLMVEEARPPAHLKARILAAATRMQATESRTHRGRPRGGPAADPGASDDWQRGLGRPGSGRGC